MRATIVNDIALCEKLRNGFYRIYNKQNNGNGRWATNELEWLIFNIHKEEFYKLSEEDQWEVRDFIIALRKIYGDKEEGEA